MQIYLLGHFTDDETESSRSWGAVPKPHGRPWWRQDWNTEERSPESGSVSPAHCSAEVWNEQAPPEKSPGVGWGVHTGLISSCWECTMGAPSPSSQGARRQTTRGHVNCAPCRRRLSWHLKHVAVQQGEDSEHRGLGRKKLARPGCSCLGVEQHLLIVSFPPYCFLTLLTCRKPLGSPQS